MARCSQSPLAVLPPSIPFVVYRYASEVTLFVVLLLVPTLMAASRFFWQVALYWSSLGLALALSFVSTLWLIRLTTWS